MIRGKVAASRFVRYKWWLSFGATKRRLACFVILDSQRRNLLPVFLSRFFLEERKYSGRQALTSSPYQRASGSEAAARERFLLQSGPGAGFRPERSDHHQRGGRSAIRRPDQASGRGRVQWGPASGHDFVQGGTRLPARS